MAGMTWPSQQTCVEALALMCDVIGGGWWKGPRGPGGTQANSKQGSEASQQTELGVPLVALSLTFRKHHCVPAIIRRAHTALLATSLTRTAPTPVPGSPGMPPTCHCSQLGFRMFHTLATRGQAPLRNCCSPYSTPLTGSPLPSEHWACPPPFYCPVAGGQSPP